MQGTRERGQYSRESPRIADTSLTDRPGWATSNTHSVLVRRSLPRRMWIGEEHSGTGIERELSMPGELLPTVPGQGLAKLSGELRHRGRQSGVHRDGPEQDRRLFDRLADESVTGCPCADQCCRSPGPGRSYIPIGVANFGREGSYTHCPTTVYRVLWVGSRHAVTMRPWNLSSHCCGRMSSTVNGGRFGSSCGWRS